LKRILHVVGARPNFMKIAPIIHEMARRPDEFEQILVHTGQHYDASMSQVFFDELELPKPDMNLEVGSVVCLDIDAAKVARLNRGELPIYEPGLQDLLGEAKEHVRFTSEYGRNFLSQARLASLGFRYLGVGR
jgi:hypothetical protein